MVPLAAKLVISLKGVWQSITDRTWSQSSLDNIVVVSGEGTNEGNNGEWIPNDSKSSSFIVPEVETRSYNLVLEVNYFLKFVVQVTTQYNLIQ